MPLLALALQIGTDMDAALAESRETRRPILLAVVDGSEESRQTIEAMADPAFNGFIRVLTAPELRAAREFGLERTPSVVLLRSPRDAEHLPPTKPCREILKRIESARFHADFVDVPVEDAVSVFASALDVKFFVDSSVSSETVGCSIPMSPASELLPAVLLPAGLDFVVIDQGILVGTAEAIAARRAAELRGAMHVDEIVGFPPAGDGDRAVEGKLAGMVDLDIPRVSVGELADLLNRELGEAIVAVDPALDAEARVGPLRRREVSARCFMQILLGEAGLDGHIEAGRFVVCDRRPMVAITGDQLQVLVSRISTKPMSEAEATDVRRAIRRLGEESAEEREAAMRKLSDTLPRAKPALLDALDGARDPEVRVRLHALLDEAVRLESSK